MDIGDAVHTPFGHGIVRKVRNNGRVLVEVRGRAIEFRETEVSAIDGRAPRGRKRRTSDRGGDARAGDAPPADAAREPRPSPSRTHVPSEVDLHGLTVEEALARAEVALNDALLAGLAELRFIHGRSSARIRDALHRWLKKVPSVRSFRVDPRNEGVTIAQL